MSVRFWLLGLLLVASAAARAQGPQLPTVDDSFDTSAIVATWKLNLKASKFPGPKPRSGLPWRPLDDGEFLIGLPFGENAQGDSGYIFVPSGLPRERLPAGWPRVRRPPVQARTDSYTAKFDSNDGKFDVDVKRTDARNGRSMTLTAELTNPLGHVISYVLVFDRQ